MEEWPENYETFYEEYKELCKKHGLMVAADGEEVNICSYSSGLWHVKDSTVRRANGKYSVPYDKPNFLPSWNVSFEINGRPTLPQILTVVAKDEVEAVEVAKNRWVEFCVSRGYKVPEKDKMKLKEIKPE